jgi:hypothetical protein
LNPAPEDSSRDFKETGLSPGGKGQEPAPGWTQEWLRVEELEAMGLLDTVLDELKFLEKQFPENQRKIFLKRADIYYQRGEFLSAFGSIVKGYPHYAAEGMPDEYWRKLYPLEYWDTISAVARRQGVDSHLVAAIIRQESAFGSRATSRAGARGVMQLMPATARQPENEYRDWGLLFCEAAHLILQPCGLRPCRV